MNVKVYVNVLENQVVSANDYEEMVIEQTKSFTADKDNFDAWLDARYTASQALAMDDDELEMLFEKFEEDIEGDVRNDLSLEWTCHLVANC
ncbi:MAG: hypothetical protein IKU45_02045 [Clostridia bacterium]|nr:hypothetical protein [Clostridia bacterium]